MIGLRPKKSLLKNERGILTLDFIFAMIMMFTFTAILFAFSITFTAVEIAQYATFAASRAYFAAHKDQETQTDVATRKFASLVSAEKAPLSTLFKNGWFELKGVTLDDFNSEYSSDPEGDTDTFVGARTVFTAKILKMRFPLLGETTDEDLSAEINSFLMREPTFTECEAFTAARLRNIKNIPQTGNPNGRFNNAYVLDGSYIPMMDDGC
jgi:hypothetical protein